MMGTKPPSSANGKLPRLGGPYLRAGGRELLDQLLVETAAMDGVPRLSVGIILERLLRCWDHGFGIDQASVNEYCRTHPKRQRQTPARN